jgi:cyclopropane fatty-acyl-phospholipid synthase-like methyltransferase
MMKLESDDTLKYFDSVPKEWDSFYSHENKFMYVINNLLRKGLYERYRLTFENCGDLSGARVLDIGCGTGRYSIECIKRGASRVVGIDFAPSMVEFSRKMAHEMGVSDKCEFICGDFLKYSFEEEFDIILALGFFDYVKEAGPVFEKISRLRPRKFVASFPKPTAIWSFQRKIRYYWIKKCAVYDYSLEQLQQLFKEAPFSDFKIIPCGKGFLGIGATE